MGKAGSHHFYALGVALVCACAEAPLPVSHPYIPTAPTEERAPTDSVDLAPTPVLAPIPQPNPLAAPSGQEPPCPAGIFCVASLPFHDESDTATAGASSLNAYACAASTNEGGRERVYRVKAPHDGLLSAAVYDSAEVDVDVHILSDLSAATCLDRGDKHARFEVTAGYYYVVVDSYVASGRALEGPFQLDIGFLEPSNGPCAMQVGSMPRVNDGGDSLQMPATGPLVMEAHLVTQDEPSPFPSTSQDELADHYGLSQTRSGLVMHRSQVWAPLEGGSFHGAGIGSPSLFPMLDEAYYVCMYWTASARPTRGTRMIVRKPGSDRAVVVAAGYETGPGNLTRVGGAPEEVHFYLGTQHLSPVTLGLAVDTTLPLGPRRCTD